MSDIHLSKTRDIVSDMYSQQGQDQIVQAVVRQIQSYLSTKTNTYLVRGWKKQSKNSEVVRIRTIQTTDTLPLGSQNTLVVLHSEKLASLGTYHVWYGPAYK